MQTPAMQGTPVGHAMPQRPQLAALVMRLAQIAAAPVPHAVWPVGQAQVPATQDWPMPQTVPQVRQLVRSVCVLTQRAAAPVPQEV